MGYGILVIAQTVALPIICGIIELAVVDGDPVLVFGKWWVFGGVGTHLGGRLAIDPTVHVLV